MPDLLHEFWKTEEGGEYGVVTEDRDRHLAQVHPDGRVAWHLWAPSFLEALQRFNEDCLGDFSQTYDQFIAVPYSDEERATQDAYMTVRPTPPVHPPAA